MPVSNINDLAAGAVFRSPAFNNGFNEIKSAQNHIGLWQLHGKYLSFLQMIKQFLVIVEKKDTILNISQIVCRKRSNI